MISITPDRLFVLRGSGGVPFTAFADGLLRTHAAVHGAADADIETNIRTNIPDGGVDTTVRTGLAGDDSGWLEIPSVWQYKGTEYRNVSVADMLDGSFVQERIEAGEAFRLALADSMPGPTRTKWEEDLTAAARAINPAAPPARVVTADELAELANRYPGFVLSYFHPGLARDVLHLEAWEANARASTKVYVPVKEWAGVQEALAEHVNFGVTPATPVRTVQGEAGIGKTRTVFEVVSTVPAAAGTTVYCIDEATVLNVARLLANNERVRAIVVADECGPAGRHRLRELLSGHSHRVRVIAIDNSLTRPATPDPELSMGKMPYESIDAVLEANFPEIPDRRRRAYSRLSEGFPRLAADLCRHDAMIADAGDVGPALPDVGDYLRLRLTAQQLECLSALSLVTKVGHSGDVGGELEQLCALTEIPRREMATALRQMHEGPGFAARAGRYFYVTPEIVAQVAFEEAWRRWIEPDVEVFLASLPGELVDAFLGRVWRSGSKEVRRACADYFRRWADALTTADLRHVETVDRLVALSDTVPDRYLPLVRQLVEAADLGELREVTGASRPGGGWGPRRALVWLAERLAQFPEFFADAERILIRLAAAESEPDITNNATGIWQQLFRIHLSGTAIPFAERLALLRRRLNDDTQEVRHLAAQALESPLAWQSTRTLGPPVVAGRIPPAEWRPRTREEQDEALRSAVELVGDALQLGADTREIALSVFARNLRRLAAFGYLTEVRSSLDSITLPDAAKVDILESIDAALAYDAEDEPHLREQLLGWRTALIGHDLHGRVVSAIGRPRWGAGRLEGDTWDRELSALADELMAHHDALRRELPWLTSDDASAAGELGEALGERDSDGALFDMVLGTVIPPDSNDLLARGYVRGLMSRHPRSADRLLGWLDANEHERPESTAAIALSAGSPVGALARILRLYDTGHLNVGYLQPSNFGRLNELNPEDVGQLYERLAAAAVEGDRAAQRIALDSLARVLPRDAESDPPPLIQEVPRLRELVWQILESAPPEEAPNSYWWGAVAAGLADQDSERAADFAARLLGHGPIGAEDHVMEVLDAVSRRDPAITMEALGRVMLDESVGWRFYIATYHRLFESIPDHVKRAWLERVGVEGARKIARHLMPPHLDSEDRAVVPEFTAWVLTRFEPDDRVFHEFAAGIGSFKVYSGDIAAEHEAEAALARRFLDHPLPRIQEWAALEEKSAREDAKRARQWAEEQDLP